MEPPDPDYVLRGFDNAVTCLSFAQCHQYKSSSLLIAGTRSGSLYLWDLVTRRIVHTVFAAHSSSVLFASLLDNCDEIVSQGRDGIILRWKVTDLTNWNKSGTYACADTGFCPIAVSQLGSQKVIILPTARTSELSVISANDGSSIATLLPPERVGMAMDVKATIVDSCVAVGYEDGSVTLWDLRQPGASSCRGKFHGEAVAGLDFCSSTRRGVSGCVDGSLVMWESKDGSSLLQLASDTVKPGIASIKMRHDGKLLAVGGCDSCVHVYSGRRKMAPLATVTSHTQTVQCVTFNVSDNKLAAGSCDKTVSVWSLYADK